MFLGTHNSWTYGKTKWYIPSFTCRCQKFNIRTQYLFGSRIFDLRFRRKMDKTWGVAHGVAFFDVDFKNDLIFLNTVGDCYVRVMLEYNSMPSGYLTIEKEFINICKNLENEFPNIKFFGGNPKWNYNTILYNFNNNLELINKYSSTTSLFKSKNKFLRILDDWIPILYAKKFNKINYNNWIESERQGNLFVDFIELCIK